MNEKLKKYIKKIIEAKGGKESIYKIPTDIIGFDDFGKNLARELEPFVTSEEICFFDETIKYDDTFHFLDFKDMLEKTELLIFTKEISDIYFDDISSLNPNVIIVIDGSLKGVIEKFNSKGFSKNIVTV